MNDEQKARAFDRIVELVTDGYAPAQGGLMPSADLVHSYYNTILNIIYDTEREAGAQSAQ